MRQIEDARKKYEEIPIPQELSGRVRAAIVRSEEKRKSQEQKIPVAGIYRRNITDFDSKQKEVLSIPDRNRTIDRASSG